MNLKKTLSQLPQEPGIYQFLDSVGKTLYIGKSVSIRKRVASYFTTKNLGPKTQQLVEKIDSVKYIKVFSEFEALLLESELIRENQPFYNITAKDDKSPIYIKITSGEVPIITLVRRQPKKRGVFLKGPLPSAKTAKAILKTIRRIFPYCTHKRPQKNCLYVHLGLCPNPHQSEEARQEYLKTIEKVKKLLSTKSKILIRQLIAEMKVCSSNMQFEEASATKKQIEKIQYLTTTYHTPRDFLENPTLVDDLTMTRLKDLKKVLGLAKIPKRIECYDISNIGGKMATGSMVVFQNGKSAKDQYRRFRIKFTSTPNDYEMHKEVLARRLKNNWPTPDLIVIDGGKGQLSAASEILTKYKKDIFVIGIAKRFEQIFTLSSRNPIKLPKESPARQLIQTIRDEAHRFAITYHRKLRSKAMLSA